MTYIICLNTLSVNILVGILSHVFHLFIDIHLVKTHTVLYPASFNYECNDYEHFDAKSAVNKLIIVNTFYILIFLNY